NEAPPLVGTNFMAAWRGRTTNDLYTKIRTSMPADNPGSVPDEAATALVAFILRQNGAAPGNQAFTVATAVPIGQVATRAAPVPAPAAPPPRPAPGPPPPPRARPFPPISISPATSRTTCRSPTRCSCGPIRPTG